MALMLLRVLAAFVLAWGLWRTWRSLRGDPAVLSIVGLGFAVRALAGALLFWVSYLQLPLGVSMQLGNGLWFFAADGEVYYGYAALAAAGGPGAIWHLDPTLPSVVYIQALALTLYLFGVATSTALVLNLVAYLGTCLAVVWIADRLVAGRPARLVALAAVSFMPSWILWSTQPLKDTFFVALIVVFLIPVIVWLDWLRSGRFGWRSAAVALPIGWVVLYGISGVRWYFGLMVLAALAFSSVWAWLLRPTGRLRAAVSAVAVLALLTQAVVIGSDAYLPGWARSVLRPPSIGSALSAISQAPDDALALADRTRLGHIAAGGSTEIRLPVPDAAFSDGRSIGGVGEENRTIPRSELAAREKLVVGTVAMLVPRAIAEPLGWVAIDGGRGLFAFADLDTVLLDVLVLLSVGLTVRQWRRGRVPHPVFWYALGLTVLVAVPLAYEAGNFGTLFRQRNMVAVGIMLLPLLMTGRQEPSGADRRTSDATVPA